MNASYSVSGEGSPQVWHGTTILTVRKGGRVVIGGDGQVSIGQTVIKSNAKKVRKLGKGDVIGGFAGATADAFTLFERLEAKLEQYPDLLFYQFLPGRERGQEGPEAILVCGRGVVLGKTLFSQPGRAFPIYPKGRDADALARQGPQTLTSGPAS